MNNTIANHVRAGYPGLYLVSHEETRIEADLATVAKQLKYNLYAWSIAGGLVNTATGQSQDALEPLEAIMAIASLPENTLILLRDFHLHLEDNNPVLLRAIKEALLDAKSKGKVIIILACRQVLPQELTREFTVIDFSLPDKTALGVVLDGIIVSAKLKPLPQDARDLVLDSASGLTTTEAENAFALSVIESKTVQPDIVAREKASSVKKNGLLEIITVKESLEDIGGLDLLKDWLLKRRDAFSRRAQEYRLPRPKGVLITGIPGTGKSLTAKVAARVFNRPLLKLDAGRLYGGLVGQSEGNLRNVIQTAEAVSPCVLWLDEIEKGLSGSQSSGQTDGGTSARVFGSFLSWMQEKTAPVFVIATANDVCKLPPEFLRKGRFDELFWVDLPTLAEREAIWAIQIQRHHRDPKKFDLAALAKATDGWTGAEIEQGFVDALYEAFAQNQEPGMLTVGMALDKTMPLSKTMVEQITNLRGWAKGRARPASSTSVETKGRKLAA